MTRAQPEYRLQCALVRAIRPLLMPQVLMFAIPNGEKRTLETFSRIAAMGGLNGLPDLAFIKPMRPGVSVIGLELKTEEDKLRGIKRGVQSDAQKALGEAWTLAGGVYRVAYGFKAAFDFLAMVGAIREDRSIIRPDKGE